MVYLILQSMGCAPSAPYEAGFIGNQLITLDVNKNITSSHS
ncbi:MAG: hypothetical protein ACI8WB_001708 [Phenylobacterium sp.]|jgi:hypothetical protein